ncbi:MAG: DUF1013 domain-containing protein [Hyphomicrobiales bacterium]
MATTLLMPKATAVWLVDNTGLTFRQIAEFCQLHELEVKGIADGDVAMGIKGMDPVNAGQLSRDEIERAEKDANHQLELLAPKVEIPEVKTKKGPRYTPVSRRQDRPDAIAWLLRHHPEIPDSQVIKLVGTTKPTIAAIRDRTHWNSANIQPKDPVALGLCSQIELDAAVRKAAEKLDRERKKAEKEARKLGTLAPAAETIGEETGEAPSAEEIGAAMAAAVSITPAAEETDLAKVDQPNVDFGEAGPTAERVFGEATESAPVDEEEEEAPDADSVFAKLAELKKDMGDEEEEKS